MVRVMMIAALLGLATIPVAIASPVEAVTTVEERELACPPGLRCGHGPVCTEAMCEFEWCANTNVCINKTADTAPSEKRQLACPPGLKCGHGPVCTEAMCEFEMCAKTDLCLSKRQLDHPDCELGNCHLPECANARFCSSNATAAITKICLRPGINCRLDVCAMVPECAAPTSKRSLSKGIIHCPEDPACKHGPICTGFDCAEPFCRDSPACMTKRSTDVQEPCDAPNYRKCSPKGYCVCVLGAPTSLPPNKVLLGDNTCDEVCTATAFCVCLKDATCSCPAGTDDQIPPRIIHINATATHTVPPPPAKTNVTYLVGPCPDICDANGNCGCGFEAAHGPVKRALETSRLHRPCPLICNAKHECVCKRDTATIPPCPLICDDGGNCGCDPSPPHTILSNPRAQTAPSCPIICKADGSCGCHPSPRHTTVVVTPVPTSPFCPIICDDDGNCGCDPSPPHTIVSDAPVTIQTSPPCPIVCDDEGNCGCDPSPPHTIVPNAPVATKA